MPSRFRMRYRLRCVASALALVLPGGAVYAQTTPPLPDPPPLPDTGPSGEAEKGFDLFREGADMMLRGFLGEVGPALRDLAGRLDDLRNYEPPVILDNGDVLIRRRPDAPPYKPPAAGPEQPAGPQVDL